MIKKLFLLSLIAISALSINSQNAFISLRNVRVTGATDTVDNAPIIVDVSGNVVVSGNSKITATQYDATTVSQLTTGINVWLNSFNVSTQKAFVTANATDASGNVYVTGGVRTNTANGMDFFTIKYNTAGVPVWSSYYNGPNSTSDVGTGIVVESGNGNVYVTGASEGTLSPGFVDYATIKYNSSGVQQWVSRYDFASGIDVPTAISLKQGRVIVSGSSGSSFTNWDFATVKYNKGNGNQMASQRQSNVGNGQDQVSGIVTDPTGNVYVTGSAWNNNTGNFDVQTQKLDTSLNVIWVQNYDVSGFDDAGINIALDDSLNVIVTGSSNYNVGNNKELIVLKYTNNGTFLWNSRKLPQGGTDAVGVRVKVKNNNEIFIGANFTTNSNQDMAILRYNRFGVQTLEKTYNGPLNSTDKLLDFVLDPISNYLFVSGRTSAGGSLDSNITLTYQIDDLPRNILLDSLGNPARTENEILVRFHPAAMTASVVNNMDIVHGALSDFLTPNAMATLDSNFTSSVANLVCYKLFPFMRTTDTTSISRSGRIVPVMHFWSSLGIILPEGFQDTMMLNYFFNSYKVVNRADFNGFAISTATANDTQYTNGNSAGLVSNTMVPYANINIEPAWDISVGHPSVTVGVFDTGINFKHLDLGNGTWAGSRVKWGFNYSVGYPPGLPLDMINSNDPKGHGSAIAGIIGAIRNNSFAISGIAGGNYTVANTGVSLQDMKTAWTSTANCNSANPVSVLPSAISQGAMQGGNCFDQEIQNHSWTLTNYIHYPVLDAFINAFDLEVVMSVAAGNRNLFFQNPCNYVSYPANYPDRWLMNVGANDTTGRKVGFSECGFKLDFLAPGTRELYSGLTHTGSGVQDFMVYGDTCVESLDGTSFAAPHAAGVAGLMLSYVHTNTLLPNKLFPEDVEEIIQRTATDIAGPAPTYTAGYDQTSGYGRLNAGQALQAIKYPDYIVKHFSVTASASLAVLDASTSITCMRDNMWAMPAGTVNVDRYKLTVTTTHTLPAGYSFIEGWERDAGSTLYGLISGPYFGQIFNCGNAVILPYQGWMIPNAHDITDTVTATGAKLTGYIYAVHDAFTPGLRHWYPAANAALSGTVGLAYTVYMGQTTSLEEKIITEHAISLYPNPAQDKVYIKSNLNEIKEIKVEVYNILGQVVINQRRLEILEPSYIDVSGLKQGIYFFNLTNGGTKIVKKVIINR